MNGYLIGDERVRTSGLPPEDSGPYTGVRNDPRCVGSAVPGGI